jgi:hypothetical protein
MGALGMAVYDWGQKDIQLFGRSVVWICGRGSNNNVPHRRRMSERVHRRLIIVLNEYCEMKDFYQRWKE